MTRMLSGRLLGGRVLGGLAAATLLVTATGAPAAADSVTIKDERGPSLQEPANQLLRGRLTYTDSRSVFIAHLERVSRRRTWVGGSVYYPDESYLKVSTTYRNGVLVTKGSYYRPDEEPVTLSVEADWDLDRDRVRIVLRNRTGDVVTDPKPFNDRAVLDVYAVTKGEMHGPHCEFTPSGEVKPCNDDYVAARLSR